ncbi:GILT-domain-containing protein, partial [Coccomyxa subellipsoidea C-169]
GGKPVRIQFVGESLCPDCAAYTTKVLEPIFSSGLKDLIELDYVGWGNAKNTSGEVECQHGPRECDLNIALNCAQQLSKSQEDFFDFLYCLEREAFSSTGTEVLQTCSNSGRLSEKALRECSTGKLGAELERAAAAATPLHQYVPWILVDDVPLGADCGNLATYICAAYTGKKPEAC